MKDVQIAYLSGIIDGEGSIGMFSNGKDTKVFTIQVTMSYYPIIDMLKKAFGGNIILRPCRNPKHKDLWLWRIKHNKARMVYQILKPFLILKTI